MVAKIDQAVLEKSMLAGNFNYGELCRFWCAAMDQATKEKRQMQIDRTIQKLRRKHFIEMFRYSSMIYWRPTSAGLAERVRRLVASNELSDTV